MGMSFGGYASLLAVTHHPARFRVAFAAAPPTEYGWIKEWQAAHDTESLRATSVPLSIQFPQLGFRYQDAGWRAKMLRESPLANLAALRSPVHLWAGARDDHVPLKSIAHYVGELRRARKQVTLLIDPGAGHAPGDARSGAAFLYFMEEAAQRHLGGRLAPPSKELQAFLRRNLTSP
jgi:dipeptidyl aminopeptidase/acylaminoacyl peptidase